MRSPVTAVLAPMEEEVSALADSLVGVETVECMHAAGAVRRGLLGSHRVVVGVTGDGWKAAARGAREVISLTNPDRVLVIGVCGGLNPDLNVCDLVLAERVGARGRRWWWPPAADPVRLARMAGARAGVVLTSDWLITTAREKEALGLAMERECAGLPAVVDVESAAYVQVADEEGLPWLVLRAVSDEAGESLPSFLERCRNDEGGVDRRKVLAGLVKYPGAFPRLLELQGRVRRCSARLAHAAPVLLEGWEPAASPRMEVARSGARAT